MATPIHQIEGVVLDSTGDMVAGSLGDTVFNLQEHIHSQGLVYPTLAAGVSVVSANADWVLGAFAQVVPASTITSQFHVHGITIESIDQNATFELVLYAGAGNDEVARIRFAMAGGFWGNAVYPITCALIAADSRIQAKLASSDGAANVATAVISIWYAIEPAP